MLFIVSLIVVPVAAQPFFDAPWRAFQTGTLEDGNFPVALTAGDLNGDGLPDAVVGQNFFDGGLKVLLNQGSAAGTPATFGEPAFYPTSRGAWDVTAADLDGDGDLDLAATNTDFNYSGSTIAVLMNSGNGLFLPVQEFAAGGASTGLTAADLDDDGDLDLVVANYGFFGTGTTVSVLMNNGSGTFAPPVSYEVGSSPHRIAIGDLDGDGDLDLVVARIENDLSVLFNLGGGLFGQIVQYDDLHPVVNTPSDADVALLDVDLDGDLDVAYTGNTLFEQDDPILVLLRNDGHGVLVSEIVHYDEPFGEPAKDISATDLNGDGRADLVGGLQFGDGFVVLLSDGAGGFLSAQTYTSVNRGGETSSVSAATVADLDADGDPDVLTVGRIRRLLSAHENLGDGRFQELPIYGRGFLHNVLDLGDVDNDGDLDAVTSHSGATSSDVLVLTNDGDGVFAESYRTPGFSYGMAKLRDLDDDGNLDLLFVSGPSSPPYDFFTARGNGDGTFQTTVRWQVSSCGLGHPGAFDLDGDGDLDVVNTEDRGCSGGPGGDRLYISLNNGDGTFQSPNFVEAGLFPSSVTAADFDGDGALDLATSSKGASVVLLGNGDGTFQPSLPLPSGTLGANIVALDLNADGHPDLATLDEYSPDGSAGNESMLAVLLGDGTGAFAETEYPNHLTQSFRNWVASGDVDGDGDADLIAGGVQDALVFLNSGAGVFTFSGRYGIGRDASAPHYADVTGDGVSDLVAIATHEDPPAGLEQGIIIVPGLTGALPTLAGEAPAEVPTESGLEANYPNPFNPSTTIRFGLPESAQVRLVVYDVLGRQISVLVDGTKEAGMHEVVFDASDLPSGMYLYRLETPQGSFARTMLLAK